MTTEHVDTTIKKTFTLSSYEFGKHRITGWLELGRGAISFAESLSPLHKMIEAFDYRPLGSKIEVIMREID